MEGGTDIYFGDTLNDVWRALCARFKVPAKAVGAVLEVDPDRAPGIEVARLSDPVPLVAEELRVALDEPTADVWRFKRAGVYEATSGPAAGKRYPRRQLLAAISSNGRWAAAARVRGESSAPDPYAWPERAWELGARIQIHHYPGDPLERVRWAYVEALGIVPAAINEDLQIDPKKDPRWRVHSPPRHRLEGHLLHRRLCKTLDDPDAFSLEVTWRGVGFDDRGSMPSVVFALSDTGGMACAFLP